MENKPGVRAFSVEEWQKWNREGCAVPVNIPLCGCSMQPLVRRLKDTVTVVPLARPLKKGDVVLFLRGDGVYVVHRVWRLQDDRVQTMGDNVSHPDAWMPVGRVLGLVTHVRRGNRRFSIDTPLWRMAGRLWLKINPPLRRLRGKLGRIKRFILQR